MDAQRSGDVAANAEEYTTDFYAWCLSTAALVRERHWDEIDPEALAEELEGLARSERRELENRLDVLLLHLLTWEHQPQGRLESHSWADTIVDQRTQLARLLRDNPSLRPQVPDILAEVYPVARKRAALAMGDAGPLQPRPLSGPVAQRALRPREIVRRSSLPQTCPWSVVEVLDADFWPDTAQGSLPTPPP